MRRLLLLALVSLGLSLIASCAGYTPTVVAPGENGSPIEWREYYDDQFKAFGAKVQPPSGEASLEQKVAYEDARSAFTKKKNLAMAVSVVLLGCSALLLIGTLNQVSEL